MKFKNQTGGLNIAQRLKGVVTSKAVIVALVAVFLFTQSSLAQSYSDSPPERKINGKERSGLSIEEERKEIAKRLLEIKNDTSLWTAQVYDETDIAFGNLAMTDLDLHASRMEIVELADLLYGDQERRDVGVGEKPREDDLRNMLYTYIDDYLSAYGGKLGK